MQEKNKNIDKFIRDGLELENTSLDFSDKILSQINSLEEANEKALSSLLQKYGQVQPSINFTEKVLSSIIKMSQNKEYQPVISKKAWSVILLVLSSVFIYIASFMEVSTGQFKTVNDTILKFGNLLSFDLPAIITSPILALSLFALSSLLFLDYYLKKRKYT